MCSQYFYIRGSQPEVPFHSFINIIKMWIFQQQWREGSVLLPESNYFSLHGFETLSSRFEFEIIFISKIYIRRGVYLGYLPIGVYLKYTPTQQVYMP